MGAPKKEKVEVYSPEPSCSLVHLLEKMAAITSHFFALISAKIRAFTTKSTNIKDKTFSAFIFSISI
jgi:hypothetical protein